MIDTKTLFSKTKDLSLLFAEDYEPVRSEMAELLETFFKTVVVASDGIEALDKYDDYYKENNANFDVVITDIVMPNMNGVEFCENLKKRNEKQQIIVLSAHSDKEYLISFINIGISKFIDKPIQLDLLFEALFSVSEKIKKEEILLPETNIVNLGEGVLWKKDLKELTRDNIPIALTKNEIMLMELFVKRSEQVCSSDEIVNYFYLEGVDMEEKNIRNMVFKLRKKLPDSAITNIYGLGYKLTPYN